jgi:hypothetical protein
LPLFKGVPIAKISITCCYSARWAGPRGDATAMDATTFKRWLGEIEGLTVTQRRQVWLAHALSEARAGYDHETGAHTMAFTGDAAPARFRL